MRDATDVLVIGGGPAGLTAAIAARKKGFSVTVADGATKLLPCFWLGDCAFWGGRLLPRRLLTWRWEWVVKNEPQRARKYALGKKEEISGLKTHHGAGGRLQGQGNA